jgi:hypothetical protein
VAIAEAEEDALAAEGRYGSLREEAAAKGRKLENLQQRIAVGGQSRAGRVESGWAALVRLSCCL